MNEMQIFESGEFGKIRTAGTSENPLFCLADLCKALDLDASAVTRRLEDGVITTHPIIDTLGRTQNANFVNEDGLYDVILDSRKPEAKRFRKWITSEVLPSIRKTGSYNLQNDSYGVGAKAVADARRIADELQQEFIGLRRGIAISKAFDLAGEMHNAPLHLLKELIPPADHDTGYLNATQIGEKLGGVPAKIVNRMLAESGLQYKDGKNWRITQTGSEYGEEMPYTKNGHSGYQIRWSNKIIPLFVKS